MLMVAAYDMLMARLSATYISTQRDIPFVALRRLARLLPPYAAMLRLR